MRIFFVNSNCGYGSTGRIITDLCDVLKSRGHQVKVAYAHGSSARIDPADTVKIAGRVDYYTHNLMSRLTDRAGFYSHIPTYKLIAEIKKFKPDLIHLHNLHGYYVNIKMLFQFLSKADIPVVWTLHDCWAITGHCSHFDYVKCDKWKTECSHCQHLEIYPKSYGVDQSQKNFQQKKELFTSVKNMIIITPSEWLAGLVRESFLGKYPVHAIPNGIDLDVFKPTPGKVRERYGIGNKKMVLAVANVWGIQKGYDDICKLAELLDPNSYQVVMVGLTQEQASQPPENIIPITRTSSVKELAELYSAADVFINPSYQETMGLVTVEAIACGTPAVVYNCTAIPECVEPQSGVVVSPGNILQLKNGIVDALALNRGRVALCSLKYEKRRQYEKYLRLYKYLLNNNNNI